MRTQNRAYVLYLVCVPLFILVLYYISDYYYLKILIAVHSSFLLEHLFLTPAYPHIVGNRVYINDFEIIRECTGIQASAVFVGLVLPIPRRPWKKKILALTLIISFVYASNVFRVAFEIWLIESGLLPYELAHYPLSLVLGIIGVFILVIITEKVYPQFPEFIMDLVKTIYIHINNFWAAHFRTKYSSDMEVEK
jgi:exosortase/archaeosortase family protein